MLAGPMDRQRKAARKVESTRAVCALRSAGTAQASTPAAKKTVKERTLSKTEQVRAAVDAFPGSFRVADLQAACPKVSLSHIRHLLDVWQKEGVVRCESRGRSATWIKV